MSDDRFGWSRTAATRAIDGEAEDPAVAELAMEIAETRNEMTGTVAAIGDRLDPAHIVRDARETVREATVGKVEHMASTAGDMVNEAGATAQQAGSGVVDTIRRNPFPAALAAIGIGLLWMNRTSSQVGAGRWEERQSGYYGDMTGRSGDATGTGERVGRTASEAADTVGRTATQAADTVGRTASEAAGAVGRTATQAMEDARSTASQIPRQAEGTIRRVGDQATRLFEQNPLAAGVVAVAVGTAVGMALPATRTEQRMMGEASERAIEQAESAISEPLEQAESRARQG